MKKILIIDDNPDNIKSSTEKVEERYYVDIVMPLSIAERKVRCVFYDLIVIDIMMPTQKQGNKSEIETGLFFYKYKVQPIIDQKKTKILFWSNLQMDTYNRFFAEQPPINADFLHKNLNNENQLLDKINLMLND